MKKTNIRLQTRWISSLEKIGPYEKKLPVAIKSSSALKGECFHLQMCFSSSVLQNRKTRINVISPLSEHIVLQDVKWVPVSYTGFLPCDKDVLFPAGGMLPDRLIPLQENCTRIIIRQTRTLWLSIHIPESFAAGNYPIQLKFEAYPDELDDSGEEQHTETFFSEVFTLHVLDGVLPSQRLKVTQWFHCDCIASFYHCAPWSAEHWRIMEKFMRNAVAHGTNMILTPVLTPVLNVFRNRSRMAVQLVKISRSQERYRFDFSLLEKFVKLALVCGMQYFEIGHLFTQWGAAYGAPVVIDGQMKFGWNTAGNAPEYREFLRQLLAALTAELEKLGIADKSYFHCSDEPGIKHTKAYLDAVNFLKKNLPGYRILDAINRVDVFHQCGMDTPVPLVTDLPKFSKVKLPERWTYYCCAPTDKAPNRFIHFPSSRNRIFGLLLWKYRVNGFLHWGYNFYYEALSRFAVDPYQDTTSDSIYPPGDAFVVYPGAQGIPEDSLRHEVFFDALQDVRRLELWAQLTSEREVRKKLSAWCGKLTMLEYPRGSAAVSALIGKINRAIEKCLEDKKRKS